MREKTADKLKTKRLLSLLLAVVILVTAQGFTALADTVSQDDVKNLSVEEEAGENIETGEADDEGNAIDEVEVSTSGNTVTPSNPTHIHTGKNDGTDTTTWSYVYFGAYPQSEVTDEATKTAIASAISQGKGQPAGKGIDVQIGDIRYRRISRSDCNYTGFFDNVDNNGYRYFKWERIKWRVLQNDGNTLFVAADMAVDCKNYNDTYTSTTWENCTLRSWLNSSFYQSAFTGEEQGAIVEQTVVNEDNPEYGTEGGNDTKDKVYLLSIREVTDETLGFCSDCIGYNVCSDSRRLKISDYANARGAWKSTDMDYEGNCDWWRLRSLGRNSYTAAGVGSNGCVDRIGHNVNVLTDAVRPALHINLSSDLWSMADDGSSGEGTVSGNDGSGTDTGSGDNGNSAGTGSGNDGSGTGTGSGDNGSGAGTGPEDSGAGAAVQMTSLSIKAPSKKLTAGEKVKLSVDVKPLDATNQSVTWEISNKKYASIDQSGKLTLKKAGAGKTVTVTARAADGSGVTASYKIKIMKHAVKSVKLKAPSKTLQSGKSMTVKATIKTTGKSVNKTLKWQSSNTKYATVNNKGKVTAKKAGKGKTVTITAMSTDGSNEKATVKIKIK